MSLLEKIARSSSTKVIGASILGLYSLFNPWQGSAASLDQSEISEYYLCDLSRPNGNCLSTMQRRNHDSKIESGYENNFNVRDHKGKKEFYFSKPIKYLSKIRLE